MSHRARALLCTLSLLPLYGCGDDVQVGSVDSLWLLWLVPVLLLFYVYAFRKKSALLQRFASPDMLARLTSGVSRPRQYLKMALVLLGLTAAVLALAEIRWGFTWEEVQRRGVDVVVALDVSDSMLVEDAESGGRLTRLERAKREIADLLQLMEGDRIGLVAFAGTAFVECPLTLDYSAAEIFLGTIDTDLIPIKGTSLGDAIRTSLEAFEGGSHPSRAIILITDGEDHSGEALRAAAEAKIDGVRIFTIGIGRDEGAPIPAANGGYRRDRRGEIVMSKLDEPTLQRIALDTGGKYVRSVTGDVDLEQIYSQGIKATLEDQELGSKRRQRWEERFQWLLGIALVALMLETLISDRTRRPRKVVGAALVAALLLAPSASDAQQPEEEAEPEMRAVAPERFGSPFAAYESGAWPQALEGFTDYQVERPEDPEVAFNLGSVHYQMRNYEEAEKAFSRAAVAADQALREQALYNLGNTAYRQGRLQDAVELYKAALDIDPNDADAKFNLEFVRDEIRRRIEEQQKQQEQQQQQQQGQEGEQQEQQQDQGQQQEQQQQQQEQEQQQQEGQQPESGPDGDQDGLPDATEQQGENPTDPANPDSDGDGLADGQEDTNRNGRVDPGETDPNNPDTDGDGVPDAQEAEARAQQEAQQAPEPPPGESLTPEEAERYLQALEEGRPAQRRPQPGRRAKPLKDW